MAHLTSVLLLGAASSCAAFVPQTAFSGSTLKAANRAASGASLSMSALPKIVVTGVGSVSAVGWGADAHFQKLLAGESGLKKMPSWADEYPARVGALVDPSFDPAEWMDKRESRRQGRYTHFAMAASKMAIEDAKLDVTAIDSDKFGVLIGSGIGGVEFFEDNCNKFTAAGGNGAGLKKVSPFLIPALISNTASGVVAIDLKARGPNFGVVSACATGTHAIGTAMDFMLRGEADVMLAGGSEAAMTPLCFAGFAAMKAMVTSFNDDPHKASRPFDKDRAGFVMGEGAGVLLLETEAHALARGAPIYCEVVGYGATCDAHHITAPAPDGSGLGRAIETALKRAGMKPEDMEGGYINAHGTSTPYNDKFETMAIKRALGDSAYKAYISSTKSMMGHTLGAAGGLEAVVCAQVLKSGEIPPTLNLDNPDLEAGCDLNYCPHTKVVPTEKIRYAISNNLGFGGHNACVAFKAYDA
eukprot:TRINITY_DN589_c0_g2_i3.p1 TRINITY_DN589_c0_g2~~TRINITY_DN589_c0_g2_i3.p1  ORF type:complete len:497 (-),score=181.45 TRINITY_DN589_c0_g2_i3:144-1556(-)